MDELANPLTLLTLAELANVGEVALRLAVRDRAAAPDARRAVRAIRAELDRRAPAYA